MIVLKKCQYFLFALLFPFLGIPDTSEVWLSLNNDPDTYVLIAKRQPEKYVERLGEWRPFIFYKLEGSAVFAFPAVDSINGEKKYSISFRLALLNEEGLIVEDSVVTNVRHTGTASEIDESSFHSCYVNKTETGYSIRMHSLDGVLMDEFHVFIHKDISWFKKNIEVARNTAFKFGEFPKGIVSYAGLVKPE